MATTYNVRIDTNRYNDGVHSSWLLFEDGAASIEFAYDRLEGFAIEHGYSDSHGVHTGSLRMSELLVIAAREALLSGFADIVSATLVAVKSDGTVREACGGMPSKYSAAWSETDELVTGWDTGATRLIVETCGVEFHVSLEAPLSPEAAAMLQTSTAIVRRDYEAEARTSGGVCNAA